MTVYNAVTGRSDAAALSREEVTALFEGVTASSAVMPLARRLPNATKSQVRIPVVSVLPTAYFVSPTDTGLKQTTEVNWTNVYLNIEEIAVICPIPQSVLDDSDYDIFGQIRPYLETATAKAIDNAILWGIGQPTTWPDWLHNQIQEHGHDVQLGELAGSDDVYTDLFDEGGVWNLVEEDGYPVTAALASLRMKAKLRALRSSTGEPIFGASMQSAFDYTLDGTPLRFPTNGSMDPQRSLMIAGDWSQLVWAVRQDVTISRTDTGVITDGNGAIQFNLWQQDMVALRLVMRLGWALPNPINWVNGTESTRFPFASLDPASAS